MTTNDIEFKKVSAKDDDVDVDDLEAISKPRAYAPKCPDNAPVVLTFLDLTVTKRGGSKKKKLLNNISGSMTGGLWAIMGPSGSGKTTLLSTIALRLNTRVMKVDGHIRLNGREYKSSVLKSMSAYVMQDDLLHAELTVAETLYWASLYECHSRPRKRNVPRGSKRSLTSWALITVVIPLSETLVKGHFWRERKRLCIAVELLNRPKLIFLDEPTSGLDSTTAYIVIKALKNLTTIGECTAVCTIHQPAQVTFELFDNLILMKLGEVAFQGSVADTHHFWRLLDSHVPAH
ncbi:ABC transporter [Fragilaria crotonensis]|nr:ABC transporter [Fragilaria crotonensis]